MSEILTKCEIQLIKNSGEFVSMCWNATLEEKTTEIRRIEEILSLREKLLIVKDRYASINRNDLSPPSFLLYDTIPRLVVLLMHVAADLNRQNIVSDINFEKTLTYFSKDTNAA